MKSISKTVKVPRRIKSLVRARKLAKKQDKQVVTLDSGGYMLVSKGLPKRRSARRKSVSKRRSARRKSVSKRQSVRRKSAPKRRSVRRKSAPKRRSVRRKSASKRK